MNTTTIPNPKRCLVLLLALATIITGQSKVDTSNRRHNVRGIVSNNKSLLTRTIIDDDNNDHQSSRGLGVGGNNNNNKR